MAKSPLKPRDEIAHRLASRCFRRQELEQPSCGTWQRIWRHFRGRTVKPWEAMSQRQRWLWIQQSDRMAPLLHAAGYRVRRRRFTTSLYRSELRDDPAAWLAQCTAGATWAAWSEEERTERVNQVRDWLPVLLEVGFEVIWVGPLDSQRTPEETLTSV